MATLLTTRMIAEEILVRLHNDLGFVSTLPKRYDNKFATQGAKIGDTVSVRLPVSHEIQDGQVFVDQENTERSVPLVIDQWKHIGFGYDQRDLTLSMDNFFERYLRDDVHKMANFVDSYCLMKAYKGIPNFVGTPGTAISSTATYTEAGEILDDAAVPRGRRTAMLSSAQHSDLQQTVQGLYNPQATIANVTTNGLFAKKFLGIDKWHMDQNVRRHTVGALGTSGLPTSQPLMDETHTQVADSALESTIHTDGWDADVPALKEGDIITIDDVYEVNPVSGETTGRLRQFVVLADVTPSTADADIRVYPPIRASGPYKTVNALPANNAPIKVFGKAYTDFGTIDGVQAPQGLIYHPEFMALAFVDIAMFRSGNTKQERVSDDQTGLSLTLTEWEEPRTMRAYLRMDMMFGAKVLQGTMGVRVQS